MAASTNAEQTNKISRILVVLAISLQVFPAACVSSRPNRLGDLADIAKLSVGVGFGLSAEVDVGFVSHPAVGQEVSFLFGHEGRVNSFSGCGPIIASASLNAPVINLVGWQAYRDETPDFRFHEIFNTSQVRFVVQRDELALASFEDLRDQWITEISSETDDANLSDIYVGRWLPLPVNPDFESVEPFFSLKHAGNFEVAAMAGIISARVGFNPLEVIDLLAGFAGFDPGRDDDQPSRCDR